MIGSKLSPVLEEIEATLWEYEAFNGGKPNYSFEGFRAAVKIFMSAIMDKMYEKQQADGLSLADMEAAAEAAGNEIRALVKSITGIDTALLYDRTDVN